jgi:hypothetical protein
MRSAVASRRMRITCGTDLLVELGSTLELFHTAAGTAFADVLIDGHRETWAVHSKRLRDWLHRRHYEATGVPPRPAAARTWEPTNARHFQR